MLRPDAYRLKSSLPRASSLFPVVTENLNNTLFEGGFNGMKKLRIPTT